MNNNPVSDEGKSKKSKTKLYIIIATIIVVIITGLVFFIHANSYIEKTLEKYNNIILDNVYIHKFDVSGMTRDEAEKTLNNNIDHNAQNSMITFTSSEGSKYPVKARDFGIDYETDKAVEKAYGVGRSGTVFSRYFKLHKLLNEKKHKVISLKKTLSSENAHKIIKKSKKYFTTKPVSARLKPNSRYTRALIVKEKNGQKLIEDKTEDELISYINNKWDMKDASFNVTVKKDKPKYTEADFKNTTDILGKFTTSYDYNYYGRRKNIENGAKKINGTIIQPGKEFSVNKAVGPFEPNNGYYLAGTYSGTDTVDGYGGGICQVATTLYNAVIRSELKITERHNHVMTVHYVPLSFDAAISGGSDDLKFKNNLKDKVYIYGKTTGNGTITFCIFGNDKRDKNRKIKFTSKTTGIHYAGTKEIRDKNLEKGKTVVEKYGQTGYSAELWKTIYIKGKKKKSYRFNSSSYSAVPQVVRIGTKKPEKKDKKDKKDAADKKAKNKKGN